MSIVTKRNEEMENGYTLEKYAKLWMNEIKDDLYDYMDVDTDDVDKQLHEVIKMMSQLWNEENND